MFGKPSRNIFCEPSVKLGVFLTLQNIDVVHVCILAALSLSPACPPAGTAECTNLKTIPNFGQIVISKMVGVVEAMRFPKHEDL